MNLVNVSWLLLFMIGWLSFSPLSWPVEPEPPAPSSVPAVVTPAVVASEDTKPALAEPAAVEPSPILHQAPFLVQAPFGVWNDFYDEMCEEAAAAIAYLWFNGDRRAVVPPDEADELLAAAAAWERSVLGTDVSTPISDIQKLLHEFWALPDNKLRLVTLSDSQELYQLLQEGLVIAPFAGRLLGNPYYRGEGPRYHVMTLVGYQSDGSFTVQDVGTRRGRHYRYDASVLFNALHDFVLTGEIEGGARTVLVVSL